MRKSITALATAAASIGLLAAAPAQAGGPEQSFDEIEFTLSPHGGYSAACGFPVALHVEGSYNRVVWTDADGDVTQEHVTYRFFGELSAHGKTIQGRSMGPETWVYDEDGTYEARIRGVVGRSVPGAGSVQQFAGLTILTGNGVDDDVDVKLSGLREDVQGICDYLR